MCLVYLVQDRQVFDKTILLTSSTKTFPRQPDPRFEAGSLRFLSSPRLEPTLLCKLVSHLKAFKISHFGDMVVYNWMHVPID